MPPVAEQMDPALAVSLLTKQQLCARWNVSLETLDRSFRRRDDFPPAVRIGKKLQWRMCDVLEYERRHLGGAADAS